MTYSDLIDAYAKRDNTGDFEFRNNTVFRYGETFDGEVYFDLVLYDTDIATLYHDGEVWVCKDVPQTNTTKNRLNDVLIPLGWRIRQIEGEWKLFPEGHDASVRDFRGGMTVSAQGTNATPN